MRGLRRSALAAVTGIAARAGYDLQPSWRAQNRPMANYLARVLTLFQIDCVLDVGANDGGYGHFLRLEVGYKGRIESFEPVAQTAAACQQAAAGDPAWHVHAHALGNQEEEADIQVPRYSQFASLLKSTNRPPGTMAELMKVERTETITIKRLEGVLPGLMASSGCRNVFLKADTQGYDLEVFRGAGSFLSSFPAVQTELSFRPLYQDMPDWRSVLDVLNNSGFSIGNMFAINADEAERAIEFDCILINDGLCSLLRPSGG